MQKILLFIFITLLLSACNTNPLRSDTQEQKTKIKSAKINAQLGISYLERQDVVRAKQKLLLALDQAPTIPETWYAMAYFLEATGDTSMAKSYYLKAVGLAPNRGDVQNNYGTYLCRLGHYQEAVQHFMLAVKDANYLNPDDAYENAGICALKIPNYAQADYFFQRAIQFEPTRPVSLIELAQLNFMKKDYVESEKKLKAFLKNSPPTAQSNLLKLKLNAIKNES